MVTSEEDEYIMAFNDDGTGEMSARGAGLNIRMKMVNL